MQDVHLITREAVLGETLRDLFAAVKGAYRVQVVSQWPGQPAALLLWDVREETLGEKGDVARRLRRVGEETAVILIVAPGQEEAALALAEKGLGEYLRRDRLTRPALANVLRALRYREASPVGAAVNWALLREALAAIPLPIVLWRREEDGRILMDSFNEGAVALSQGRLPQFLGQTAAEFFMDDPETVARIHHVFDTGESQRVELPYELRTTGEIRWLVADYIKLSDLYLLNLVRDVTAKKKQEVALQTSKSQYRLLAENATDIIIQFSPEGECLYVSPSVETMLGYTPQEFINFDSLTIVHPEDQEYVKAETARLLAGKVSSTRSEARYRTKDGHYLWLETTARLARDGDGRPLEIIGISRDMTERKRTEDALRQSQARNKAILNAIPDLMFRLGRDGRIFDYAATDISDLLLSPEQVVGSVVGDVLPADVTGKILHAVKSVLNGQEMALVEYDLLLGPETQTFEARLVASGPAEVLAMVRNVTERKRAEEALQKRHQLAMTLVDTAEALNQSLSVDEVLQNILDATGELVTHDGAYLMLVDQKEKTARLAGYCSCYEESGLSEPEMGVSFSLSALPHTRPLLAGENSMLLISDTESHPGWREANVPAAVRSHLSVPVRVEGETIALLGLDSLTRDFFTERDGVYLQVLAQQAATAIHNAQLHESVQNQLVRLRETQDRLLQSEKLAAIGELVAGVAHELNNPLSALILNAQLLQQQFQSGSNQQTLETIVVQAQRASNIVRNLLDFARQRPSEQMSVRVNDVVQSTVDLLAYELRTHNIEVFLDLARETPLVLGDAHQLQQVLVNLINNALYVMKGGGGKTLHLATRVAPPSRLATPQRAVQIMVRDAGPGIPPEAQSRIFDPFFTTKIAGEGTGLGLSVCYGIVQEHQGRIWVESEEGEGAAFWIELPFYQEGDAEMAALASASKGQPASKQGRILVVDDEESILTVLPRILRSYEVSLARRGEMAVQLVSENDYDLILCDLYMPGMNGIDFYRYLQEAHPRLADRVLFMTGDVLSPYTKNFLQEVEATVLIKPFEVKELQTAVSQALSAASPALDKAREG